MPDLRRLFAPRSLAVIGGGAWCANVIRTAQNFGFPGEIHVVHPNRTEIAGQPAVRTLADLPDAPDAAFVGVNHSATLDLVSDLANRGAGGAVAFASGFGEVDGPDAQSRQEALVQAAGTMPVIGPNCYGFVNALDRVAIWPDQHGLVPVGRGVAILTQSSNLAINLTMQRRGLPIGFIGTAGNQAQIGLTDLARALIADSRITAIGLHIEGIGDIRGFEAMAQEAGAAGKPVVALKAGASEAARAATMSHTASLAGSGAGASALFHRLGCVEADSLGAFLETLKLLHVLGPLGGTQLASMSCSGGEASLIADTAHRLGGLSWANLTDGQRSGLAAVLGPKVTLANPLDYHTYIWNDPEAMARTFAAMLDGPQDLTLLVADFPRKDRTDPADWACIVTAAKAAHAQVRRPFALLSTLPDTMPEDVVETLAASGIAALSGLEDGMRAVKLAGLCVPARGVTAAPIVLPGAPSAPHLMDEAAAKRWLAGFGVAIPRQTTADCAEVSARMAAGFSGPVVLKGLGLAHKTDAGAVALNLRGIDAVRDAAERMNATSFLIEEQVEGVVAEMLVGVLRDPAHGFVLTLGAGGVLTELWQDSVSLLVPASWSEIDAALDTLRTAPLLNGFRGRPKAARTALIELIMAVQDAVIAEADVIEEVEINPVIVTSDRAVAVDALVRKGVRDE